MTRRRKVFLMISILAASAAGTRIVTVQDVSRPRGTRRTRGRKSLTRIRARGRRK